MKRVLLGIALLLAGAVFSAAFGIGSDTGDAQTGIAITAGVMLALVGTLVLLTTAGRRGQSPRTPPDRSFPAVFAEEEEKRGAAAAQHAITAGEARLARGAICRPDQW